ncbi:hypothetical protein BDF14DRAFT_1839706 [Spinellus fusiger]|nr:hypothetical protein BDF14DRAFT_1839706 [Spinellus fusiger]
MVITTVSSSFKERKISLKCKHGGVYRAAKATSDTAISQSSAKRATSTLCSLCPMHIVARRKKNGMITITRSLGEHNHPLACDVCTYAAFRKMEPKNLSIAILMLKKHTPTTVMKALHQCFPVFLFLFSFLLNCLL